MKQRILSAFMAGFVAFGGYLLIEYHNSIGHWFAYGIPWARIGLVAAAVCAIVIIMCVIAALFMKPGVGVFGVIVIAITVFSVHAAINGEARYRNYQERVVTVQTAGTTIVAVCQRWRPTWLASDCAARIHEHNRAVDLDHLQVGDKLYLDINIGHKNGGNDSRTEIDYHKQVISVSSRYPTLSAICNRWRPTWKVASCVNRVGGYNRLPKFTKLTIGQRLELPVGVG